MLKPLSYKQSIARIYATGGTPAGGGFLLDQNRLLTCAHVVQKALGLGDAQRETIILGKTEVEVDLPFFPVGDDTIKTAVTVINWELDVAVLTFSEPLAETFTPLGLAPTPPAEDLRHHRYWAYGFPKGSPAGKSAEGVILDINANGWIQLEKDSAKGVIIDHGFSGTPLLDEDTDQVIGLVVAKSDNSEEGTGWAICTQKLIEAVGPLPEPTPAVDLSNPTNQADTHVEMVQGDNDGSSDAEQNSRYQPIKPDGETVSLDEAVRRHFEQLAQEAKSVHHKNYVGLSSEAKIWRERPAAKVRYMHIKVREEYDPQPDEQIEFDDAIKKIKEIRRAVLLGEPGSGKTTTLLKLAVDLMGQCEQTVDKPIPLFVRLGRWREDEPLELFLQQQAGVLAPHLTQLLADKQIALLLDGVNEVPAELYKQKFEQVAAFAKAHAELLLIVSCRTLDYQELKLSRIKVEPLDPLQIQEYVCNYLGDEEGMQLFWELAAEGAESRLKQFSRWALKEKLNHPDKIFWCQKQLPPNRNWGWSGGNFKHNYYWRSWIDERDHPAVLLNLAKNPYMLYMIVSVFDLTTARTLPKNRGDLFDQFVIHLIGRETAKNDEVLANGQTLTDLSDLPNEGQALYQTLIELAWEMQQAATETVEVVGKTLTTMPFDKAENFLTAELGSTGPQLARKANLLEIENEVRFTHQLLQEYFAARALDKRLEIMDPAEIWPKNRWWEPTNWEETVILLAGLYGPDCSHVVNWLADAQPELAARCLTEAGVRMLPDEKLKVLREKWKPRLTNLKRDPDAKGRAAVGRALGRLELSDGTMLDDRPGVSFTLKDRGRIPQIEWGEIVPAGVYAVGGDEEVLNVFTNADAPNGLKRWLARVLPSKFKDGMIEVQLEHDFSLAQFPVTMGQFECFKQAADVDDPRWWIGLPEKSEDLRGRSYKLKEWSSQAFKFSNHPREHVSWYQAIAFCRWLSDKLGVEVGLPHEYEWEVAARWPDGRFYPYGNWFDAEKGNTDENAIIQTTTVGIYPNGINEALNLYDLSGNVWEWCQNKYEDPVVKSVGQSGDLRVLRGGAWTYNHSLNRAAVRDDVSPTVRDFSIGFRLVRRSYLK